MWGGLSTAADWQSAFSPERLRLSGRDAKTIFQAALDAAHAGNAVRRASFTACRHSQGRQTTASLSGAANGRIF